MAACSVCAMSMYASAEPATTEKANAAGEAPHESPWAGSSIDELNEALAATRSELVAIRHAQIQKRHLIEQENAEVRVLMADIEELRDTLRKTQRQLNLKSEELELWFSKQDEFSKLKEIEDLQLQQFRELSELIQEREQSEATDENE